MILSRRQLLSICGSAGAVLTLPHVAFPATETVEIAMGGRANGASVWFDPIGVLVKPRQRVRWTNRDPSNSHTTTAYNPANFGRSLRMPKNAVSWNSDFLLPGDSFSTTLITEGVYDYYCLPHEHAGMVGRIVVGEPGRSGWTDAGYIDADVPEVARRAFPAVEDILQKRIIHVG